MSTADTYRQDHSVSSHSMTQPYGARFVPASGTPPPYDLPPPLESAMVT